MPLSITNIASMTAQRSFLNSNSDLETAFELLNGKKSIHRLTMWLAWRLEKIWSLECGA